MFKDVAFWWMIKLQFFNQIYYLQIIWLFLISSLLGQHPCMSFKGQTLIKKNRYFLQLLLRNIFWSTLIKVLPQNTHQLSFRIEKRIQNNTVILPNNPVTVTTLRNTVIVHFTVIRMLYDIWHTDNFLPLETKLSYTCFWLKLKSSEFSVWYLPIQYWPLGDCFKSTVLTVETVLEKFTIFVGFFIVKQYLTVITTVFAYLLKHKHKYRQIIQILKSFPVILNTILPHKNLLLPLNINAEVFVPPNIEIFIDLPLHFVLIFHFPLFFNSVLSILKFLYLWSFFLNSFESIRDIFPEDIVNPTPNHILH